MLVCPRQKYCWIEVPKTGSSALNAALSGRVFLHPMKHISSHNARRLMSASLWDAYDTWAVIREPVDWLGSWYRFFLKADRNGRPRSYSLRNNRRGSFFGSGKLMSFNDFIAETIDDEDLSQRLRPQASYVTEHSSGKILIKNLIAYANLPDEMTRFAQIYGIRNFSLPEVNIGADDDTGKISDENIAIIREKWAVDFSLYDHTLKSQKHEFPSGEGIS